MCHSPMRLWRLRPLIPWVRWFALRAASVSRSGTAEVPLSTSATFSIRRLAYCALATLGIAACAPAPPPAGLPPDRLARFFDELVYGNPAEPEGVSRTLLR